MGRQHRLPPLYYRGDVAGGLLGGGIKPILPEGNFVLLDIVADSRRVRRAYSGWNRIIQSLLAD